MKTPKLFRPKHKAVGRTFNGRKAIDALYDTNWKAYRVRFLAINDKCYRCGEKATVVDHLRPHKGDVKLFKQLDNHIPLCEKCHNTVTGLFDKRFTIGGSIQNKIDWLVKFRMSRDLFFKVKVLPYYGPEIVR